MRRTARALWRPSARPDAPGRRRVRAQLALILLGARAIKIRAAQRRATTATSTRKRHARAAARGWRPPPGQPQSATGRRPKPDARLPSQVGPRPPLQRVRTDALSRRGAVAALLPTAAMPRAALTRPPEPAPGVVYGPRQRAAPAPKPNRAGRPGTSPRCGEPPPLTRRPSRGSAPRAATFRPLSLPTLPPRPLPAHAGPPRIPSTPLVRARSTMRLVMGRLRPLWAVAQARPCAISAPQTRRRPALAPEHPRRRTAPRT